MKKKGVNINLWFGLIFLLVAAVMVLFGVKVREANQYVKEQAQIEENRRMCELACQALSDGSDYLTNEVYHYVATKEAEHLENYWHEVNEVRSRDTAIEQLMGLSLTEEESRLVKEAKQASDQLIYDEAWAMRLTADSAGVKTADMPEEVARIVYTNGEEALVPEQKRALASEYIFGREYTTVKDTIKKDIELFRRSLGERKSAELETAVAETRAALGIARSLMAILMAAFLLEAFLFYYFMIRPFNCYTGSLGQMDGNDFTELKPMGARNIRAFADVFNRIYADWQTQKERLEKERYRFHVAIDNTSVIVYEYDAVQDVYTAFGKLEKNTDLSAQIPKERVITDFLKEHALELMGEPGVDYFNKMLSGAVCAQTELQIYPYAGNPCKVWASITGKTIYDGEQKVSRVIGKIVNIQTEKEKEFALEDARSRDGLTGLYKREAGIRKVRAFMEKKSPDLICGMMLVDMDNFAQINEKEGHVFADAVLQDAAYIFRTMTGEDDILVRLGGDEFMLFIKDCPKSRATVLGPELEEAICGLSGQNNSELKISASIGMCVTEVVDEYNGLYRCAESILNYVKEHGKARAACYLDTSNELGMMLTQMYPERRSINEIDKADVAWEDIPAFALDLFGKSKSLDDAVYLLFSRVGIRCGADRIVLMEFDMEYLSCHAKYQWSRYPSYQQKREVRYVTREDLKKVTDSYDAEGMSDQRTIVSTEEDGMESILHAAIWNQGQCVGAMSFERKEAHSWTKEERQLLSDLTKIISSFTLKARADAVSRAKTDFLSRMSHEIRTPMNAITGMTAIAKTVSGNPPKTQECLDKIESANKYLLSLINDVLDMSRIESGKVELHRTAVRIGKMTENVEMLIRPQAESKGLLFTIKNGFAESRPVWADELRLNQVLLNLLGNAVKFTGEGGKVTLEIRQVEQTDQETMLCFSVTDTGIGISGEAQGRIFNAFEQSGGETASSYGGTGLGLTISSSLVQLMGGSLEVESEPGRGASFYFTLKLPYAPEKDWAEPAPDPKRVFDPHGKRLLLVEDNALNREIAQEILEMNGFCVETAENGREAVSAFEQSEDGYFDAMLMDIRMPVMGGMEATRRIRTMGKQDSRTVPIVAMTANAFDEDMKKSLENGMNGYLTKPIDAAVLLEMLGKLIDREKSGGNL